MRARSWMKASERSRRTLTRERNLSSNWSELSMWDALLIFGTHAHVARVSQDSRMCDYVHRVRVHGGASLSGQPLWNGAILVLSPTLLVQSLAPLLLPR